MTEEHEQKNDEGAEEVAQDNGEGEVNEIASFMSSLNVRSQIEALVINNLKRYCASLMILVSG